MSSFKSTKAARVLAALERIGWRVKRSAGTSHKVLERDGWPNCVFAFHEKAEIGPVMLKKIAKHTGLTPEDI